MDFDFLSQVPILGQGKSHIRLASELFLKVMLKIFNIQYSIFEKPIFFQYKASDIAKKKAIQKSHSSALKEC